MEVAEHIVALQTEGANLAAAARSAGLDALVPTEPWNVELDDVVGSWPAARSTSTSRCGTVGLPQT